MEPEEREGGRPPRAAGRRRARAALAAGVALALLALGVTYRDTVRAGLSRGHRVRGVESRAELLRAAAEEAGVDAFLLAGMVFQESGGDARAVSSVDALGLLQLKLDTARERAEVLGLPEPSRADLLDDPALNARLGAHYFRYLVDRYDGEVEAALCAYNTGPTRLDRWIAEAGDYAAWRDAMERRGDSQVLGYARSCLLYAEIFRERGIYGGEE